MSIEYTTEETAAQEAILAAMEAVKNLDGPDSKLAANHEELAEAVHVLQSFLKQHVLHRLDPESWSNWWELRNPPVPIQPYDEPYPIGLLEAHEQRFGDLKAA